MSREPICAFNVFPKDHLRPHTWASGSGSAPPTPADAKKAPSQGLFLEQDAGWAVSQQETYTLILAHPVTATQQRGLDKTQGRICDIPFPTRAAHGVQEEAGQ